jgi:hypothetical protein
MLPSPLNRSQCAQKGFLGQVFRQRAIAACQAIEKAQQRAMVTFDQHRQISSVTTLHAAS